MQPESEYLLVRAHPGPLLLLSAILLTVDKYYMFLAKPKVSCVALKLVAQP